MGFQTQVNDNSDRAISVASSGTEYFVIPPDPNKGLRFVQYLTASIKSDVDVTFWFEWGRGAYDFRSDVSTCLAGGSKSQLAYLCGAPNQARLAINNATGGAASVTRDVGIYG